jgi:hypothetical protein
MSHTLFRESNGSESYKKMAKEAEQVLSMKSIESLIDQTVLLP